MHEYINKIFRQPFWKFWSRRYNWWREAPQQQSYVRSWSYTGKLKEKNKINDEFLIMLNRLTLEELICLKLEIASKFASGKLCNLPLFTSLTDLVKDAVIKYAYSISPTNAQAATYTGLNPKSWEKAMKKYGVVPFFDKEKIKEIGDDY